MQYTVCWKDLFERLSLLLVHLPPLLLSCYFLLLIFFCFALLFGLDDCLCLGRRGMDDGYTYGMQPSSARASVASSEGYGPNRASRSTHEDAFGGGDPLGESPLHSAIHSSTSLPSCMNSFVLAFFYQITYRLLIDLVTFSLFVHSFLSVSQSVSQTTTMVLHSRAQPHASVYNICVIPNQQTPSACVKKKHAGSCMICLTHIGHAVK